MKHNGERQESPRRPDEILAEIDRTRNEMDSTLSAIEHRLTPGQLVDQGIDYLRHSGANEFVQNLGGQVKHNPLPVSLVGIGLAWLMAASKREPDYGSRSGAASYGAGLGERAGEAKEKMAQSAQSMRERASATAQNASAKLGDMRQRATAATQSAKETIGAFGPSARSQMDRAKSSADYMMREQPLALGAIGVAVGAFLAAMAPRTRQEDELMGGARDRLVDKAQETGKEKLDQAKQAANSAMKTEGSQPSEAPKAGWPHPGKGAPSTPSRPAESPPAGKPTVRVHGEAAATAVPPPVGADLTPRGPGGARGKP
jgi:ElaB/YqjD/DUF883 family membrane-anchored ribosome-binding protein